MAAAVVGLVPAPSARAQTIPPHLIAPVAWPATWTIFTRGGNAVRDPEGGKSTDSSNGGASFGAEQDLASGWNDRPGTPLNPCNPIDPASSQCGTEATMWWAYSDGGSTWDPTTDPTDTNGSPDMLDDTLFFRMRVNGDPRETGNSTNRLNNSHWNFLHDIDNDGYKEFWFDVFGNQDIVRVLYENNGSQQITNENARVTPCVSPLGVWLDTLVSCADATGTTASGYSCAFTHTRAMQITTSVGATPGTTEWFIDLQIPLSTVRIPNDGCEPTLPRDPTLPLADNQWIYLIEPISPRKFVYSTSDSSVDPLQKDYTPGCNIVAGVITTCNFTDATPVTLASFEAIPENGRVRLEWTTGSELGNAGFNVYAKVAGSWMQVNPQLVPSKVVDSLEPVSYTFTTEMRFAEAFAIVDVDVEGRPRWHGEFEVGRRYGAERRPVVTDWATIATEHERAAAERAGQRRGGLRQATAMTRPATATWPVFELRVDREGLYRVTYEELAAAGLDLAGVSTGKVGLTNRGEAVPIRVEGSTANPRELGAGSFIEFYGTGIDTLYTDTNVYRIVVDSRYSKSVRTEKATWSRLRPTTTSYTETAEVENDSLWSFAAPNGDPWFDRYLLAYSSPVSASLPLMVNRLEAGPATLSMGLWGVTNWFDGPPDHHVQVALNGTTVGESRFDGLEPAQVSFAVPAGVLREGANTVTLTVMGDTGYPYDMIALDRYAVSYPRSLVARNGKLQFKASGSAFTVSGLPSSDVVVYRLDAAGNVTRLTDFNVSRNGMTWSVNFAGGRGEATYQICSVGSLSRPAIAQPPAAAELTTGAAEYLIITHPDFTAGLAPLVAARRAQGLTVKVVETDTLYSTFGNGIFGPEPIQEYVRYAVSRLGTRFVLLVGGDTYDYKNKLGLGSISFVPTFYMRTEGLVAFTPVDGPYGDVNGDMIPDVAVGRLPVRTTAQLATVIDKILTYQAGSGTGSAIFAADRAEADSNFAQISNQVIDVMPAGWDVKRAYIDDFGVAGARSALIAGINDGAALTHYLGHSDLNIWTFLGLFSSQDLALLTNQGRPTAVVQWGCWNTFFTQPNATSIGEQLLVGGPTGAAAVIGPSARTSIDGDREMDLILTPLLLQPGMTMGEALTQAKQQLRAQNATLGDVFYGVNLMGDPALAIVP